jgi:hypothetical protein
MRIETSNLWDNVFFEEYKNHRNQVHEKVVNNLPLSLNDYEKIFGEDSLFKNDFSWIALVVYKNEQRISQAILCWRKESLIGHLGFLDLVDNQEANKLLIDEVEKLAKKNQLKEIKTPVDLNFFVKYRIKISGTKEPFYGEPIYPDYYEKIFKDNHLTPLSFWDTYEVDTWQAVLDFFKKRKNLGKKNKIPGPSSNTSSSKLKIRSIRLRKWDEELQIIYQLFIESYSKMPEFESICFEQFKILYNDFKYIIQPWLSYIIELEDKPVGFCINYVDPLPVLEKVKNKKLTQIQKLLLLIKIRFNFKTLLISYVGKIPGPNGEDIKGVQFLVSKRLTPFSLLMNKVLVTYQSDDSPSRRSWDSSVLKEYSRYALYGKKLE